MPNFMKLYATALRILLFFGTRLPILLDTVCSLFKRIDGNLKLETSNKLRKQFENPVHLKSKLTWTPINVNVNTEMIVSK